MCWAKCCHTKQRRNDKTCHWTRTNIYGTLPLFRSSSLPLSRSLFYRARQLLISYLLPKMNLEFEFSLSVGKTIDRPHRTEPNLTLPEIRLGDKRAINLTKSNVNKPYDTFIIYFDVLPSNTPPPFLQYVHTIDLLIKPHARSLPFSRSSENN